MEYNQLQTPQVRPKNWLIESILATIFCCLPVGIAGIVYAAQVNSKWVDGDYEGALKSSREAGKWTKIAFFLGIGIFVINIILFFALGWTFLSFSGHNDF